MARILIAGLMAVLVACVVWAGALVLQGCGLRIPFFGTVAFCETAEIADRARTDRETAQLDRRIALLERELAALRCEADPPPPPAPPAPEPAPVPPPPPEPEPDPPAPPPPARTESGLAPDAFQRGDVAVMEGCWELVTEFSVRERRTGQIDLFRNFEVCFDQSGQGRQVRTSTRGTRCEGPVSARIDYGTLVLTEPVDLVCTNGLTIYRAITNCTLDAQGKATCRGLQPEVNARSELFILRRKGSGR